MPAEEKDMKSLIKAYAMYNVLKVGAVVLLYLVWMSIKEYFNLSI